MTITSKYPDDFEDVIYQSLLSIPQPQVGISISDLAVIVTQKSSVEIDNEILFRFVQRLCQEGMAEKTSHNLYKAVKFDPTDLPVF